jgi:hypothetical protein
MKTIVHLSLHGCVGKRIQGWISQLGIAVAGVACLTAALAPVGVSAAPATPITQLQYIQSMVQALGDAGQFTAASSAADYIQWAKNKGMQPSAGWSAGATMTAESVALTWVQLLGLNPTKYGRDYFRNLDSAGVHIDPNAVISQQFIISLLDQPEAQNQVGRLAALVPSPTKPGNGVGFGVGWYRHRGLVPPATPPGPPPGAQGRGNPTRP